MVNAYHVNEGVIFNPKFDNKSFIVVWKKINS